MLYQNQQAARKQSGWISIENQSK